MKKLIFSFFIAGFLFISFPFSISAQLEPDTLEWYRVITTDDNEFYGPITFEDEDGLKIQTELLGELYIPQQHIKLKELLSEQSKQAGEVWLENLQATRYFWAPNGYGLQKGEGYYQNVWVLFNQASVGITDNISVGAGVVPLFLFGGAPTPVFAVPKFSIPVVKDKFNVGGGAIVGTILGEDVDVGPVGIGYAVATVGPRDMNATLGVGYGFADGESTDFPIITLGAMARVTKRTYLMTENYFIKDEDFTAGLISIGGRTVFQRIALDYGGIIPVSDEFDELFVFPWLSLSVPFQY